MAIGPVSISATDLIEETVFWKRHANVDKDFMISAVPAEKPASTDGPYKDSTIIMNIDFDYTQR